MFPVLITLHPSESNQQITVNTNNVVSIETRSVANSPVGSNVRCSNNLDYYVRETQSEIKSLIETAIKDLGRLMDEKHD